LPWDTCGFCRCDGCIFRVIMCIAVRTPNGREDARLATCDCCKRIVVHTRWVDATRDRVRAQTVVHVCLRVEIIGGRVRAAEELIHAAITEQ
jgi:hypothetical protein